jgi:UDP-N-acetylmuramate dehydrogenase
MPGQPQENVPLARYTTLRLGGPARYFCECRSEAHVRDALAFARDRQVPVMILGGGSNVVIPDEGFPGLVARITIPGHAFRDRAGAVEVTAGAGTDWDTLVRESVERGVQGLECLSGIPGLVGGVPIQNVGAYGQEVAETIVSVDCLERERGRRITLTGAECGFAYRTSRFKSQDRERFVVLAVTFRLRPGGAPTLRYPELRDAVARRGEGATLGVVREAVLALRRRKSMVLDPEDPNTRSVGSFFTNPVVSAEALGRLVEVWRGGGGREPVPSFPAERGRIKVPAAWLIEHAGFAKGLRRGGVGISSNHALALVNFNGTASELLALAEDIRAAVLGRFGVGLEMEPVVMR